MNIETGYNKSIDYQLELLQKILFKNKSLKKLLKVLEKINIDNYYVGAGCINQTIFNYYHGYNLEYGISDYDIVYYDKDTSYEAEDKVIKKISLLLKNKKIKLDIKNQARVHIWYKEKFKHDILPSNSVEESISRWGTTVTCIGVRLEKGKLIVFAPYGLNDLFGLTINPIKDNFIKEDYETKTSKWKQKWPKLKIISWDGE